MPTAKYTKPPVRLLLIFVLMIGMGCEVIQSSSQDRLIARAENHYLYLSDIEAYFEPFNSEEDSLIKVRSYINDWARQKLMYEKSLINLSSEKISELNEMVSDYENMLFSNAYREFVLKSTMDSVLKIDYIQDFYEANKLNFRLKEAVYKVRYIIIPLNNVDSREITKRFKRFQDQDMMFIDSLSFQLSNYFLSDSIWINENQIRDQLYFLTERQQDRFLKSPNYYEVKDSLALYLLQLVDRLDRGNVVPLSYAKKTIENIVFNKRKIEFLKSFDNDILQDAIKTKKFETY